MPKNIDEVEFTIFDTETTGLNPDSGDRIVEIAGIRFKGNTRISTFQSLVNPDREISPAAFVVNKITADMLKSAPGIEKVLPDFLNFIYGSIPSAYNAAFDLEFLNSELKLMGKDTLIDTVAVDILKMAKRLLPGLERYALWFVAERLGIKQEQRHRAFSDVELSFNVFNRLKDILQQKGISDVLSLTHLFSINPQFMQDIAGKKIASIQEAIDLGVKLKIKYFSSSGAEVTERKVLPKEIKQENNRAYLVGYCCLRNEERTFRIDGILHLEIL